jgi:type III secretory pathway component EscU
MTAVRADKHYMSMNLKVGFLILLVLFTFSVSASAETLATAADIKCVDEVSSSTYQWIAAAAIVMCMALLL